MKSLHTIEIQDTKAISIDIEILYSQVSLVRYVELISQQRK